MVFVGNIYFVLDGVVIIIWLIILETKMPYIVSDFALSNLSFLKFVWIFILFFFIIFRKFGNRLLS